MHWLVAGFLLAAPAAGTPLRVAPGAGNSNAYQVLGLGAQGLAVRELWRQDRGDGSGVREPCAYPGLEALQKDRPRAETIEGEVARGVRLLTWKPAPVGQAQLAQRKATFEVYADVADGPCTKPATSTKALENAKHQWATLGLSWDATVAHVTLWDREDGAALKDCVKRGRTDSGCSQEKNGRLLDRDVRLSLNLLVQPQPGCVPPSGDQLEHGCQAERRYRGEISLGEAKVSFDLVAEKNRGWPQHTLQSVELYSQGGASYAVFLFGWTALSLRERVPVLLRVE